MNRQQAEEAADATELEDFYEEHGREPYGIDEFMRWRREWAKSCAEQFNYQLEQLGKTVTPDGRVGDTETDVDQPARGER